MGEKEVERLINEVTFTAEASAGLVIRSWIENEGDDWLADWGDLAQAHADQLRGGLSRIADDHPEVYELSRLQAIAHRANSYIWQLHEENEEESPDVNERETFISETDLAPVSVVKPQKDAALAAFRAEAAARAARSNSQ